MSGGQACISTCGLGKTYRRGIRRAVVPALVDLDLTVVGGEIFGFLGQNGAGKSTTIKVLAGLIRPTTGSATICGFPAGSREARAALGFLPENPSLPPRARVRELISLSARLGGVGSRTREVTDSWIERLGLASIVDRPAGKLSKGQAQLTALATALVGKPRLLILDEPMSGLDPVARKRVRDVLLETRDRGSSIFLSSHILGDMERLCDRVGLIRTGRMVGVYGLDDVQGSTEVEVVVAGAHAAQFRSLDGVTVAREGAADTVLSVSPDMVNTVLQMCIGQGARVESVGTTGGRLEDLVLGTFEAPAEPAIAIGDAS